MSVWVKVYALHNAILYKNSSKSCTERTFHVSYSRTFKEGFRWCFVWKCKHYQLQKQQPKLTNSDAKMSMSTANFCPLKPLFHPIRTFHGLCLGAETLAIQQNIVAWYIQLYLCVLLLLYKNVFPHFFVFSLFKILPVFFSSCISECV